MKRSSFNKGGAGVRFSPGTRTETRARQEHDVPPTRQRALQRDSDAGLRRERPDVRTRLYQKARQLSKPTRL